MAKRRFRVLRGLAYPTDPKIIKRIQNGEKIPWAKRKMKEVEPGAIVDDWWLEEIVEVPEVSVDLLIERGVIEEVGGD